MKIDFDDALNKASWLMLAELVDTLGVESSATLFNGLKPVLLKVIQQYCDDKNLEVKQ